MHRILLQRGQRGLVLLLQLALLLNLSRDVITINPNLETGAHLYCYLLLELLIKLLKLLELGQLLGVLLESSLKLGLLRSLAINLTRRLSLGPFTGWDVGQATSWIIVYMNTL